MTVHEQRHQHVGIPILTLAEMAANNTDRERLRIGIGILGRCMMYCQGGWYWAGNSDLDWRWYSDGEWAVRKLHDALCHDLYQPGRAA